MSLISSLPNLSLDLPLSIVVYLSSFYVFVKKLIFSRGERLRDSKVEDVEEFEGSRLHDVWLGIQQNVME